MSLLKALTQRERKQILLNWNTKQQQQQQQQKYENNKNNNKDLPVVTIRDSATTEYDDDESNSNLMNLRKSVQTRSIDRTTDRLKCAADTTTTDYDNDYDCDVNVVKSNNTNNTNNISSREQIIVTNREGNNTNKTDAADDWRSKSRNVWAQAMMKPNSDKSSSTKKKIIEERFDDDHHRERVNTTATTTTTYNNNSDEKKKSVIKRRETTGLEADDEENGNGNDNDNNNKASSTIKLPSKRTTTMTTNTNTTNNKIITKKKNHHNNNPYEQYTRAMERLAQKMNSEMNLELSKHNTNNNNEENDLAIMKRALEKKELARKKTEQENELLRLKRQENMREQTELKRRFTQIEEDRLELTKRLQETKKNNNSIVKEKDFTIEAQGMMLEQLRQELELAEKISFESDRKFSALQKIHEKLQQEYEIARDELNKIQISTSEEARTTNLISIAHEKCLKLATELKDTNTLLSKEQKTTKRLSEEVLQRKKELQDIQRELEKDCENEREKRVVAETKYKELIEELKVVRNERDERCEELKVLESAIEKLAKEKEDLRDQVKQREIEILKQSNEISEKDELMQEQLDNFAELSNGIDMRDIKAIASYDDDENDDDSYDDDVQNKRDQKSTTTTTKVAVQQKAHELELKQLELENSRMLAKDRQKVTEMAKKMRDSERSLVNEKQKLKAKELEFDLISKKYEQEMLLLPELKSKLMTLENELSIAMNQISEKDLKLRANEELLQKLQSEKKKHEGEISHMRATLEEKNSVVLKMSEKLKDYETTTKIMEKKSSANNNTNLQQQQQQQQQADKENLRKKESMLKEYGEKVARLEKAHQQSNETERILNQELEGLKQNVRSANAERVHLEQRLKVAEENAARLSSKADTVSSAAESHHKELFEAKREVLNLRTKLDDANKLLEEMSKKVKEAKEECEEERNYRTRVEEDCAFYLEDYHEIAEKAAETIVEHQTTIIEKENLLASMQRSLKEKTEKFEVAERNLSFAFEQSKRLQSECDGYKIEICKLEDAKNEKSSGIALLEHETSTLHKKLDEKQFKLNSAIGDISKYKGESEQSKRQLEAFRSSKEVTEEQLKIEREKLKKSEENCKQLAETLKRNIERHDNVISANGKMHLTQIEQLEEALKESEAKGAKISRILLKEESARSFFESLDVEMQVIVESFCGIGGGSSPSSSPSLPSGIPKVAAKSGVQEQQQQKTPANNVVKTHANKNDGFVSAPSSPIAATAELLQTPGTSFKTPKTSMQSLTSSSRLGRTTMSKSAGKATTATSDVLYHTASQRSMAADRIWGMVSEASKVRADLRGLAESASKAFSSSRKKSKSTSSDDDYEASAAATDGACFGGEEENQEPNYTHDSFNDNNNIIENSVKKKLRLEDSGHKQPGTPDKRRALQPVRAIQL
jgi:hypothetical protein